MDHITIIQKQKMMELSLQKVASEIVGKKFPPKVSCRRARALPNGIAPGFLCRNNNMADAVPVQDNVVNNVVIKESDGTKGKSLFANRSFSKGDVIFQEKPLVCAQFLWNTEYNYLACDHCMKSLETAQDMARRLTGDHELELPHTDQCCDVSKCKEIIVLCPRCQVLF